MAGLVYRGLQHQTARHFCSSRGRIGVSLVQANLDPRAAWPGFGQKGGQRVAVIGPVRVQLQGLARVQKDGEIAGLAMRGHAENGRQKGDFCCNIATQKIDSNRPQRMTKVAGGDGFVIHHGTSFCHDAGRAAKGQITSLDLHHQRPDAAEMFDLVPLETLLAFTSAGILLNLTPGADVMFATASGMAGGPRAGIAAGAGVGLGGLWHVGLAALGVAALLAAHPAAMAGLRLFGAGYLLYLAWGAWNAGPAAPGRGISSLGRAFWRGFVTNALNPKVALFVLAFLPQFTDPARGPVWQQVLILGAVFTATGTCITAGYGALAGWAGQALSARMGVMNKLAAGVFGLMALRMIKD